MPNRFVARRLAPIAVIALAAAALPSSTFRALAQNQAAALSGSVYDATGGVLPGVEVALEDPAHQVTRARTDSAGRFRFASVAPGTYKVQTDLAGFKSVQQELDLRQALDWDQPITLQVGTLQETISVVERRPAGAPVRPSGSPVRIGGNIKVPTKLVHIAPTYPRAMRDAGIEGV